MLKNLFLWIHDNIILVATFVSVALLIFAQSYFLGAYISPDSTNYLRAAQALRDGYGLHVNAAAGDSKTWFSIWPAGYPAMIAFVSLITRTEIYLASKILSVVILAFIFIILYRRFKKHAWMYALIAVNLGFLQIFYYTWSEQPFILGLLWLSFAALDIVESDTIKVHYYISITLSALWLFFSRYIGAFSAGAIGLLALLFLISGIRQKKRENVKKAILLFAAAAFASAIMAAYLFCNYKNAGFFTGTERLPITDHPLALFVQLCKAQIIEMQNVFMTFFKINYGIAFVLYIACAVVVFRFIHRSRRAFYTRIPVIALLFLSIGLLYWIAIVVMRFSAQFDDFTYRLLFPASALFSLGIISLIHSRYSGLIEKLTQAGNGFRSFCIAVFIALSIASYTAKPVYNVGKAVYKHQPQSIKSYRAIRSEILDDLSSVPSQSIVISHWSTKERYANFMRPDILMVSLKWPPKSQDQISSLFHHAEAVYVYTDWSVLDNTSKDEIYSFLAHYAPDAETGKKLIRIK
jgi:hypothetical protein